MIGDYLTSSEYAKLHGLPLQTVRTRLKKGQLPHIKSGNRIYIKVDTPWEEKRVGRPEKKSKVEGDANDT